MDAQKCEPKGSQNSAWVRVSGQQPCPVCGKRTYCTLSADGAVAKCMRVESDKVANGALGGWIHKLTEPLKVIIQTPAQVIEVDEPEWQRRADAYFHHELAWNARLKLAQELGVGPDALKRLNVGYGTDRRRNLGYTTWPEKRPGGKVVGIVRRYGVNVKEDGNKLMMRGSKHGLYLPTDWWKGKGPVLLVEGGSDTAALLTMGLSAIGRPSNLGGVNMLIGALQDSGHRALIVIGENDKKPAQADRRCGNCGTCLLCHPGREGARLTAGRLAEGLMRKVLWRMIPEGFKDSRDWLNRADRPTAARFLRSLM